MRSLATLHRASVASHGGDGPDLEAGLVQVETLATDVDEAASWEGGGGKWSVTIVIHVVSVSGGIDLE